MSINGIKILSQIWLALEKKWLPAYVWSSDPFTFWQERILFVICFTATVLGPLALIPSVLLSFSADLVNVAVLDIVAYIAAVIVLISRNAPFKIRAGSVFCILYVLGAGLLFFLGPIGAGYIWLLGASIIISTLYDFRAVILTLVLNVATLLLLGFLLSGGMLD